MTRLLRALNLPAIAVILAFIWAVCAVTRALEPFAPLIGAAS